MVQVVQALVRKIVPRSLRELTHEKQRQSATTIAAINHGEHSTIMPDCVTASTGAAASRSHGPPLMPQHELDNSLNAGI